MRVLFSLVCRKCYNYEDTYSDGKIYVLNTPLCPKCGADLRFEFIDKESYTVSKHICDACGYLKKGSKIEKEKEDVDFEKDRERFCVAIEKATRVHDFYEDIFQTIFKLSEDAEERKKNKHIYDARDNIKRLRVVELKSYLTTNLQKE